MAEQPRTCRWRRRLAGGLAAGLAGWYLLATLPYLADFPIVGWAQTMIAAPAYKLATLGVYGSDMFTGFYRAEHRNYDHMPLYPLFLALSFKLFGLGVAQARVVSVIAGLAVVALTLHLGRRLYGVTVGIVAATFLCFGRLAAPDLFEVWRFGRLEPTGIPLVDFARVIRFDVMVPAWMLASCACFIRSRERGSPRDLALAGAFAGLATLTHLYGVLVVPLLLLLVLHRPAPRWRAAALVVGGWIAVISPYVVYVLLDSAAYRGQMLRHAGRFALADPAFYWDSLTMERWRYVAWIGGSFDRPILWPRAALWVLIVSLPLAWMILAQRLRSAPQERDRLLLYSIPVVAGGLALLVNMKRYYYTSALLPFLALHVALVAVALWRAGGRWRGLMRIAIVVVAVAVTAEGASGVATSLRLARVTTPYRELTARIARVIPAGSRVLSAQSFWFGLIGYEFRSINLAFVLSDPQYRYPQTPSLGEVIDRIDPDYVVLEYDLLASYLHAPGASAETKVARQWRAFDDYVRANCAALVAAIPAREYGNVLVYRCGRASDE